MNRKSFVIDVLGTLFKEYGSFYVVNISRIPVVVDTDFRNKCFEKGVFFKVAKNSLIKKALEKSQIETNAIKSIEECLKLCSALMFIKEEYKVPAELISDFQKKTSKDQLYLKCAYIDGDLFFGNESLDVLKNLKSRTEIIANIVSSLTCGIKDVVSAFQGVNDKISGIVKSLGERS